MNYIINFFETLQLSKVGSNIEFESSYEVITVAKNNGYYLFNFHKGSPITRTNLCKEILMLTENEADFKIKVNHPLSLYFDRKNKKQEIEDIKKIDIKLFECDLVEKLESHIQQFPNFQKIYSYCKMQYVFPEKKIIIKKTKI